MNWRSLGFDQYGNEQFAGFDPATGNPMLKTVYADAARTTDRNAQLRLHGHGNGKDMKLAASVDGAVIGKWMQEGFNPFAKENKRELERRLNDSDYRKFRIWEGQI